MDDRERELEARVKALEARLAQLEHEPASPFDEVETAPTQLEVAEPSDLVRTPVASAPPEYRPNPAQWSTAGLMLILAGFAILYRVLVYGGVEQTALLFVGLPAFLGAFLALLPRSESFTGMALKGTSIALLMSSIVLQEGFICVLMASPIFLAVAVVVGALVDASNRQSRGRVWLGWAVLLLAAGEGAVPGLTFDREEVVIAERVVAAPLSEVRAALAEPVRVDHPLTPILRIGWPVPVAARGDGLELGDRRIVHFAGGEGEPGDMVFEVASASDDRVVFRRLSDQSHLAHWLSWDRSVVELTEVAGGTRVTWTVEFTRELDPAWYFAPLERAVVRRAADWLIDAAATP